MMDGIWALSDAITVKSEGSISRSQATVTRVDNEGIVWIHIPGGIDETPVNGRSTANVEPGDSVFVEIVGGRANIVGNSTSPSVSTREINNAVEPVVMQIDDISKQVDAAKTAATGAEAIASAINQHFWTDKQGVHVTQVTKDEFVQTPSGPNQLSNSEGLLLRDGSTYLSAFTTDGQYIYDGHGNGEENIIGEFTRDGIKFYVSAVTSSGTTNHFDALSMSANNERYGGSVNVTTGDLAITSFVPTYTGHESYTYISTPSGAVYSDGYSEDLLGGDNHGDIGIAGAGVQRGLVFFNRDGKLVLSSEAHTGIVYDDEQEVDKYFNDIRASVEASAGIEIDADANYVGGPATWPPTTYSSSEPNIRMWSENITFEGETKSHQFAMDDVIDTLLGNAHSGTAIFQGELSSQSALESANYKSGWYWLIVTAGTYAGNVCESGDMIYSVADRGSVYSASDFAVVQTNQEALTNQEIETLLTLADN